MNTPGQNASTPSTPQQSPNPETPQLTNSPTTPATPSATPPLPNSQTSSPTPTNPPSPKPSNSQTPKLQNSLTAPSAPPLPVSNVLGEIIPLTDLERAQLMACEEVIATGWATFVQVGLALATIRNGDLYRQDFGTFEEYCRAKWEYGRNYVNRMISAAEVFTTLVTIGHQNPENERQVRPLISLTADQARTAWNRAVEKAAGKRVTARLVKDAVQALGFKPVVPPEGQKKAKVKQSRNEMLKAAFAELVSSIKQRADHQLLLEKAQILEWRMGAVVKGVIADFQSAA